MNANQMKNKPEGYVQFEDDMGRWYGNGTKRLISITNALDKGSPITEKRKDYLLFSTKESAEDNLRNAGQFGTQAHEYFEKLLRGEEINPLETHAGHVERFRTWINTHNVKPLHLEEILYSERFGYAGTCDFIGHITTCLDTKCCRQDKGEVFVVADWKTSRDYDISFGYQMAAYRYAAIEMGLCDESIGMMGVHLPRTGTGVKSMLYEHYEFCFEQFLLCLEKMKGIYFNKLKKLEWEYLTKKSMIINWENK